MSTIDDAITNLAAARAAYDAANQARYDAQMAEEAAGADLGVAQTALNDAVLAQIAAVNTADVIAAAKTAAISAISATPAVIAEPTKVG